MEPHLKLVILNHYVLTINMILFTQQLNTGLKNCKTIYCYCKNGYFKKCLSFSFKSKNKLLTWHYKCFFSCVSKDFLYVLICTNCDFFYNGQTEERKQHTRKHKSDVTHSDNSDCERCSEHLRTLSKMRESYFNISPFLYEKINTLKNLKKDAI